MKQFTLKEQTLDYIINYLVTKPYNEVYQLIALIQKDMNEPTKDDDHSSEWTEL